MPAHGPRDHGSAVANLVARRCVVPPWRDGGQAQYVERAVREPAETTTAPARAWALTRLDHPLGLGEMATRAGMSRRTFTRRFRVEVGLSPGQWLTRQRVGLARDLLETTDLAAAAVATRAGFGTAPPPAGRAGHVPDDLPPNLPGELNFSAHRRVVVSMVEVIGAGFGRTGTASLKRALEMLGFGPCHHMSEVLKRPETAAGWATALTGDDTVLSWLLSGYRATLDLPSCLLWRELVARYPRAKVVLTVRDPRQWYRSARATILSQDRETRSDRLADAGGSGLVEALTTLSTAMATRGFRRDLSEAETIALFQRHNDSVRAEVKAERLLVYEVEQGWAPLCDFLGVDAPTSPFPRGNDSGTFQENVDQAVRSGADFD